jgi:hypothetical protein
VGAQQLVVLAEAKQLRALHIPHAHSLQDRSLQVRQHFTCRSVTATATTTGGIRNVHVIPGQTLFTGWDAAGFSKMFFTPHQLVTWT